MRGEEERRGRQRLCTKKGRGGEVRWDRDSTVGVQKRREVTAQKALCTVRIELGNGNGGGEGGWGRGRRQTTILLFRQQRGATGRRQGSQQTRGLFLSVSCCSSVLARAQKERYRCRRRRRGAKATGVGGQHKNVLSGRLRSQAVCKLRPTSPLPTFFGQSKQQQQRRANGR